MAKAKVDFTMDKTDFFVIVDQAKRRSAMAMVDAINHALFHGSLGIGKVVEGCGLDVAFRSRAVILRERSRLMKIAGIS